MELSSAPVGSNSPDDSWPRDCVVDADVVTDGAHRWAHHRGLRHRATVDQKSSSPFKNTRSGATCTRPLKDTMYLCEQNRRN